MRRAEGWCSRKSGLTPRDDDSAARGGVLVAIVSWGIFTLCDEVSTVPVVSDRLCGACSFLGCVTNTRIIYGFACILKGNVGLALDTTPYQLHGMLAESERNRVDVLASQPSDLFRREA